MNGVRLLVLLGCAGLFALTLASRRTMARVAARRAGAAVDFELMNWSPQRSRVWAGTAAALLLLCVPGAWLAIVTALLLMLGPLLAAGVARPAVVTAQGLVLGGTFRSWRELYGYSLDAPGDTITIWITPTRSFGERLHVSPADRDRVLRVVRRALEEFAPEVSVTDR